MPRLTILFAILALLVSLYLAPFLRRVFDARSIQCAVLSNALGAKVSYPTTATYNESTTSYFSAFENELSPGCVVRPTSKEDVATIVKTLRPLARAGRCQLAVKGGGHTPFAGSANINRGVTVDMDLINGIDVSPDRKITSIGAGERWGDVHRKLDAMALAVVGGRVSKAGVAGLILGGER